MHWQDTPHVVGMVADATTLQPIAGARLHYNAFPKHEAYTGADGQYDFPAISHWGVLVLLPVDRLPPHGVLTVEGAGYAPTNICLMGWFSDTNEVIYLRHK